MKNTRTVRGILVGALAAGALIGGGAAASAAGGPEVSVQTQDFPLEYQLVGQNDTTPPTTVAPNTATAVQANGHTSIQFSVNGKPVNGAGPIEEGKPLHCIAGGTAEAPSVDCHY